MVFLKNNFNFNIKSFFYLSLSGIIGLAVGDLFLLKSFLIIGPQLTMLIFTSSPLITLFLSLVTLKESIKFLNLIGIFIVLSGIAIAISGKKMESRLVPAGVFYSFMGSLMQALGLILAKKAFSYGIDTLLASFLRLLPAYLFTSLILPFFKLKEKIEEENFKREGYIFLFAGSIIGPFLGVWFSQISIKYSNTGIAATLLSLTPIFLIPLDYFFEKEKIGKIRIFGTIIAITGLYFVFNYQ